MIRVIGDLSRSRTRYIVFSVALGRERLMHSMEELTFSLVSKEALLKRRTVVAITLRLYLNYFMMQ